jgi:hypothetical protein
MKLKDEINKFYEKQIVKSKEELDKVVDKSVIFDNLIHKSESLLKNGCDSRVVSIKEDLSTECKLMNVILSEPLSFDQMEYKDELFDVNIIIKRLITNTIQTTKPVSLSKVSSVSVLNPSTRVPTFLNKWGSRGSSDGQLSSPYGIYVSDGYVYVCEYGYHRIQVFTCDGLFVCKWGSLGSDDEQMNFPIGITVSNGLVYVVENGNHRIQVFTTNGSFVRKWGSKGSSDGKAPNKRIKANIFMNKQIQNE